MSEATVLVDGLCPLLQASALGLGLLVRLPFGLQDQHVARLQSDDEVRAVLPHNTPVDVEHLEAQVVVLDPGVYQRVVV